MILTTCLVQSCPLPLILEGTSWHLLPPSSIALWALGSSCMSSSTTLSFYQLQAAVQRANKEKGDLGQTHHPIQSLQRTFSLFTRNTCFLGGGFTDSDESDSYAGDLPDGPGDLFTRVRRFQGSTGPPSGGPGFQAGPPRGRPGFMFPPPPAGPPPEPGDLYSVLQCKEFNIATKKHKSGTLFTFGL